MVGFFHLSCSFSEGWQLLTSRSHLVEVDLPRGPRQSSPLPRLGGGFKTQVCGNDPVMIESNYTNFGIQQKLDGGFHFFLEMFIPILGEMIQILTSIFFKGVGSTTNQSRWRFASIVFFIFLESFEAPVFFCFGWGAGRGRCFFHFFGRNFLKVH